LVQFSSQSASKAIVRDTNEAMVNETFKAVMDSKCQRLVKPSRSLEDEPDFEGFDNKFILPQRFYDFESDADNDVASTKSIIDQHHSMLDDEEDIFVNIKTQNDLPVASTSAATGM